MAMMPLTGKGRRFLFLQGPHGPFFSSLARAVARSGADCWRVGFNAGDALFWRDRERFIAYRGTIADWPGFLADLVARLGVTDIVLYGDTRPVHAEAVKVARAAGLGLHVFEEGYLRPYWITYERGGSNGNSRIMSLSVTDMRAALSAGGEEIPEPPSHWGDMREHILYGALYHAAVLLGRKPTVGTHRGMTVSQELRLYLRRLMFMPAHWIDRVVATWRVLGGGFPYHLVLLQLEHDASFRSFSPFSSMVDFIERVIEDFERGAPPHHHLVFKAHPLEDGRAPVRRTIRRLARARGISDRVHFVRGGKLARLMDTANTAITVNSTAAQQALWRGLPVKTFGTSVYDKPELVSRQSLVAFLSAHDKPDIEAYRDYRRFLLDTSQVPGGFYSTRGRRQLLRKIVDLMLDPVDPYERRIADDAAARQQLRIVR